MNKEIEQNKEESTLVNNDEKTIIKHIVCSGGNRWICILWCN